MKSISARFKLFPVCAAAFLLIAPILSACSPGAAVRETGGAPSPTAPSQSLIPMPVSMQIAAAGSFEIDDETVIVTEPGNAEAARIGRYLAELIWLPEDAAARVRSGAPEAGSIYLTTQGAPASAGAEGYALTVTQERVTIAASEPAGLFYGVQTLRQLLLPAVEYEAVVPETMRIPAGEITDYPRFAWRGAMLDVSRHFFSTDEVKRYIDLMALYKLNRLHLHLSDDQGWRIEIESWPKLTQHAGSTEVGGGPGGFYTQEEYADLVRYAQDRFIMVVPEIDMPGHTNAALASYADLNCDGVARDLYTGTEVGFSALCVDKETTYQFVSDVVREIGALTPGPYFHIGGDEVERIPHEAYLRFIERVEGIVQSHGKQIIGWGEVAAANLSGSAVIQHWRPDSSSAAVARGSKVILSPASRIYVDMKYHEGTALGLSWAGLNDVRDAYDWEPAEEIVGVPETAILGVEAPLWSETLETIRDVEYMAFPRLAGVAEIGWSPAARRSWDSYRTRLGAQAPRWTALGINFYRSPQVPWGE